MKLEELDIAGVLKRVFESFGKLNRDDMLRLADPDYIIEIKLIRRRSKEEGAESQLVDLEKVLDELSLLATRDEAQTYLNVRYPSKKVMELIARKLDIPIVKKDKVDELRDKIVEATVGSRIRSQAIQGRESAHKINDNQSS